MTRAVLYVPSEEKLVEGGMELVDRWASDSESLLWLALREEDPEREGEILRDRFSIHPLAVADALRDRHPPKIEVFPEFTFILLKGLAASEQTSLEFRTIQISLFVGERFLVTRTNGRSVSSEKVFEEVLSGELEPDAPRAALALRLCQVVSDRYLPILLRVEQHLEEMEQELITAPSDDLLAELVTQKSDLKQMLRLIQYHDQVFRRAQSSKPRHLAGHERELLDVQEQLDRHLGLARLYFDLMDDLMQGYLSLSSHRLNRIMQTLTIVTVVFVPVTFIAGVYGMNFEHMPELSWSGAYFGVLGLMLLVMVSILLFFYWRGWLGGRPRSSSFTRSRRKS